MSDARKSLTDFESAKSKALDDLNVKTDKSITGFQNAAEAKLDGLDVVVKNQVDSEIKDSVDNWLSNTRLPGSIAAKPLDDNKGGSGE